MKVLVFALFVAFATGLAAEDKTDLPESITLTTGTILRKISVVRWNKDSVVIKHTGGVDPIRLSLLPADTLAVLKSARTASENKISLKGEVFITTNGGANITLGGTQIRVYRANLKSSIQNSIRKAVSDATYAAGLLENPSGRFAKAWSEMVSSLPNPSSSTYTDSRGKFSVDVFPDYYCLVVIEQRMVGANWERYVWVISKEEVTDPDKIILTNHNKLSLN